MSKPNVFCERCGARQPADPPRPGSRLSRMLDTVGLTAPPSPQHEPYLRLCLSCRGYSCPECWNDAIGACQTCEPLTEPAVVEPVSLLPDALVAAPADHPVAATLEEYGWPAQVDTNGGPEAGGQPTIEPLAAPEARAVTGSPEAAVWEPIVTASAAPERAPQPVLHAEAAAEPAVERQPASAPEPESATEPVAIEPAPGSVAPATVPQGAPLLPTNPFGSARQPPTPPVRPRIEFDVPPPPAAFMIERHRRAPLLPPPVSRPALDSAAAVPQAKQCSQCQLPLSSRAAFCRRCGSSQSASA